MTPPSPDAVRAWFPTLASGFAYLENAGGSQVPTCVADAVRTYMLGDYVQLGAGYGASRRATAMVEEAHAFAGDLMGVGDAGRVVLGASTTALLAMLAGAYAEVLQPGDEVVIAQANHEANAGPWARLKARGVVVRWWRVDSESCTLPLDGLREVLSERTRIVALPHVSNLLGEVADLRAVCALAHAVGARVVADGVAYSPHRAMDVAAWGVDWYMYSCYKVYGPHLAAMFGRHEAFEGLTGPNHFFMPRDSVYKWEPGGVSHESAAGLLGLRPYLAFLTGGLEGRAAVEGAFAAMEALEQGPLERLLAYLRDKPEVRIVGPREATGRVATVSFLHERLSSPEIVAAVDRHEIGIRYGHMYAWRLCEALGIDPVTGVVRVSLVHYNTEAEVERLIEVLETIL